MIKPTVGRIVWFWGQKPQDGEQPLAAIIARVWGPNCVNLAIFDASGIPSPNPPTSVRLLADGEAHPDYPHCCWMPFQVGQAKANEVKA